MQASLRAPPCARALAQARARARAPKCARSAAVCAGTLRACKRVRAPARMLQGRGPARARVQAAGTTSRGLCEL
eukprot:8403913-Alexandrium_andersonii.AAC.1